jgi:hypothetical protein
MPEYRIGISCPRSKGKTVAGGSIYLLSSHIGRLYIGVTSNLYLPVTQHKEGALEGFTARENSASTDVAVAIKCVPQQGPVSGFGGRKAPSSMGTISTVGVLRLRAFKRCVTR